MRSALGLALLWLCCACDASSHDPTRASGSGAASASGSGGASAGGSGGSSSADAAQPLSDAASRTRDAAIDAGSTLPSGPCAIDAEEPALPGVRLRVEGENCRVETGKTHRFSYRLELDEEIDYVGVNSFGACGRCAGYTDDPESLIDYSIGGGEVWYCMCDVGCCPPTLSLAQTLQPGIYEKVIEWPGRQWRGPSDTNAPPGDAFPAGDYVVSVTFDVPNLGALTARLPIEVFGEPAPDPGAGASCEVNGEIYASGEGGIDDPISCNSCNCDDGQLACTEIACAEACPNDTAYGTSCSQCGPTDACEVVRHGCLPACDTAADCTDPQQSFCSNGVCRNVCG